MVSKNTYRDCLWTERKQNQTQSHTFFFVEFFLIKEVEKWWEYSPTAVFFPFGKHHCKIIILIFSLKKYSSCIAYDFRKPGQRPSRYLHLIYAEISKDWSSPWNLSVHYNLAIQGVICQLEESGSPGSLWEMKNFRVHPDLLNQNFNKISKRLIKTLKFENSCLTNLIFNIPIEEHILLNITL